MAKDSRDCTPVNASFASVNVEQAAMSGAPVSSAFITLSHEITGANPPVFRDHVELELFNSFAFRQQFNLS